MTADEFARENDIKQIGFKWPFELHCPCNMGIKHVFKFLSSLMEKAIPLVKKQLNIVIGFDRKDGINIKLLLHIHFASQSKHGALEVFYHRHHLCLVGCKEFISLCLKSRVIDQDFGIAFGCDCLGLNGGKKNVNAQCPNKKGIDFITE